MKRYIVLFDVARLFLIMLFTYTGISKLWGHQLFLDQLLHNHFMQNWAGFISIFIPVIEIITVLALLFSKTLIIGWWASTILISLFSIYISMMLLLAPQLPCSCGGIIAALSWKQHLLVNITLAILCWTRLYHYYFIRKFSMHTRE